MKSDLSLIWRVPELPKDDPGSGQIAGQLFEGKESVPIEQFVREDLQNRVDARIDKENGAARVVFKHASLPGKMIDRLFPDHFRERLRVTSIVDLPPKQAETKRARLDALFSTKTLPVLLIEDFNTTGLNGPVNSKQPVKDEGSPLFHATNALTTFLRRHGRSGKSDKALGSAGLGRHVYYKASEISTKFIYTVPADLSLRGKERLEPVPARPLFFGQSFQRELEEIDTDGKERSYICYHHLTSPKEVEGYPMPLGFDPTEGDGVEALRRELGFLRTPEDTGCSILIPYPRSELSEDRLVSAMCAEFALPFLRGNLVVEVGGKTISADTITRLSDDDNINATNAFLEATLRAADNDAFDAQIDVEALQGALSREVFSKSDLEAMSLRWRGLDPVFVALTVPVTEDGETGTILVAVQKCPPGERGRRVVARGGLVITSYSDRRNQKPWNGCTLVGDDELGHMLRRSETPSHDKWVPNDLADAGCVDAKALITFVRNAHNGLHCLLDGLDADDDVSIFADVLPDTPKPKAGKGKTGSHGSIRRRFDIELGPGGQEIRVSPFDQLPPSPGQTWDIVVVLDSILGAGRARRSFRSGTFDLREVPREVSGGRVLRTTECSYRVRVDEPDDFLLSAGPCGFPDWADVRVHVEQVEGEAG